MQRIFLYLLSFFFLSIPLVSGQIAGTQFKEALISKQANLHYVYNETPGFSAESNGRMIGLCVDIMADFEFFLLDKYGIKVKAIENKKHLQNVPDFFKAVRQSEFGVFGLSNITITEDRAKNYTFSPPFIKNYAVMLSHNKVSELSDITYINDDFKGLTALTVASTTNHQQLLAIKNTYWPDMPIKFVKNFDKVINIISKDSAYFTLADMIYMTKAIEKNLPIKEHISGVQPAEEYAIILPANTDWDIPLKKFLTTEYKESLSYRKIVTRHLGWETLRWMDEMNALEVILLNRN